MDWEVGECDICCICIIKLNTLNVTCTCMCMHACLHMAGQCPCSMYVAVYVREIRKSQTNLCNTYYCLLL